MRSVPVEKLVELQCRPDLIRNICILAHVDHGKTTLADSLVAANGIISSRMVGKLRYMDSRPDEQERGITMKSSAIALYHSYQNKDYLINLIDSPGHIDFSGEVSTATRMCDGAIIVVDVVEGVCPQTHSVLRQAWHEGIKPILVLNKIDRLITELKMTTAEAYQQMERVLEEVNALAGNMFLSKIIDRDEEKNNRENGATRERRSTSTNESVDANHNELEGEDIYFLPENGTVVFASAVDGWGFRLENFLALCQQKTGLDQLSLKQGLWGDYYFDAKSKTVRKGAFDKGKKPMFVQMILDTIWTAYNAIIIKKDNEMIQKITTSLNIGKIPPSKQQDPKSHLQAVMGQWLPLAESVLSAVCELLPSPNQLTDQRAVDLVCPGHGADALGDAARQIKKHIRNCSRGKDAPVVIFVSKMFAIERSQLPQYRRRPMTAEQLQALRVARQQENRKVQFADGVETAVFDSDDAPKATNIAASTNDSSECEYTFVAFARVFSGTVTNGDRLHLISANSDRAEAESPLVSIDQLYMMMGRELEAIDQAPAGNVIAIGGLEDAIFKTATLSSIAACPPLTILRFYAHPIVRVSIEPKHPVDMPKLVRALKLLNQTDPSVKTFVQETGEHVLVTAGEVHLQRCLTDLRERFSDIELNVSEPIIPFHETIVPAPATASSSNGSGSIVIKTANQRVAFRIRAKPIPPPVLELLDRHESILKNIDSLRDSRFSEFRSALKEVLDQEWKGAYERLWTFGPKRAPCNVLINSVPNYSHRPSVWNRPGPGELRDYDQSVVSGFQLRCQSGPLCDEPMRGVAFVLEEWSECSEAIDYQDGVVSKADPYGPLSGQIIAAMKEGCKLAFQIQPQRLSMAMYSCLIQATSEVLGRVYAVLSKRAGRVLKEDIKEGTNLFEILATLPVVESFGFADEIRTRTSGLAFPQLVFSHWEVQDLDPFWIPSTEEELSHYGDKSDTENRALKYMNAVRRRKGLPVDEKIVEHGEKQRTLARKV